MRAGLPASSFPLFEQVSGQVALAGCGGYAQRDVDAAVVRLFDLLGGARRFVSRGERVLIKPNLIVPAGACGPAQTHPAVILSVARMVKDLGAVPMVGDSPAWQDTAACLRSLGTAEELERLGAEVVQLDEAVRVRIDGCRIGISRRAMEADKIINVPKFKAHQQLGATFAVKNLFGCVVGKEKACRHFTHGRDMERFCRMLIGIYAHLRPVVNIIDGITAMEGQGPIHGTPKELGVLIAGEDPFACERVCCRVAGIDPESLPILRTAQRLKIGREEPELAGGPIEPYVCPDFRQAELTPLQFTLPRICKSVARQLVLLARDRLLGRSRF